ncbi:6371_t:CDS:1, partial [Acaulospora colombiana]
GRKYLALYPTSGGDNPEMIAKRNEIRELIKEAVEKNDLDNLNRRFREEAKMQIIKKMEDDNKLKKRKLNIPQKQGM